jgi:hypothetical protein
MTVHRQSPSDRGVRRGVTGLFKRTVPDLLLGLALIYVGAIGLSFMVDGYLRGVAHGVLILLGPAVLLFSLLRSSGATVKATDKADQDTSDVWPSKTAA